MLTITVKTSVNTNINTFVTILFLLFLRSFFPRSCISKVIKMTVVEKMAKSL